MEAVLRALGLSTEEVRATRVRWRASLLVEYCSQCASAIAGAGGGEGCWRRGQRIEEGEPWDLGHVDGSNKTKYAGPEHVRCNRSVAGRKPKLDVSRAW